MGKFHILIQVLQGNALFSGKNYTAGTNFTRPPVVTNLNSGGDLGGVGALPIIQYTGCAKKKY